MRHPTAAPPVPALLAAARPVVERLEGRQLLAASPAGAGSGDGLRADYFDNGDLTAPVLSRVDPTVDFDWKAGSPDARVGADTFSARWSGRVEAEFSETYRFTTRSDDGVRLWLDGRLLIDDWTLHAPADRGATIPLRAGQKYDLVLEYFEQAGGAQARLSWSSPSRPSQVVPQARYYSAAVSVPPPVPVVGGTGLRGEYFDNADLTGPSFHRVDPTVDFDWRGGSPGPSIGPDTFSARWTGQVEPATTATYTFHTTTDDGSRLWVDGRLVVDDWSPHSAQDRSGTVSLQGGRRYEIKYEYFENGGDAIAKLGWSAPGVERQVVPAARLFPAPEVAGPVAPPPHAGDGLRAEYFDDADLTDPVLTRIDPTVDFDWGAGSPDPRVGPDTFSARWTGQVLPQYSERYTFRTYTDDGARLWVDGKLVVDDWTLHGAGERIGTIDLEGGRRYDLKLEYFDQAYDAVAGLRWSSRSQAPETVPQARLFSAAAPSAARGTLMLGAGTFTVAEGGGQVQVPVRRVGGTAGTVTVDYQTVDGTAVANRDYVPTAGVLTIPDGADRGILSIPILDDAVPAGDRSFSVSLNGVTGADLSEPRTAIVTIRDDDQAAPPTSGGDYVDFRGPLTSYSNQDSRGATVTVSPDGRAVTIGGNSWKKLPLSHRVTADTVVEFEFRADGPRGEILGIGLDDDNDHDDGKRTFKVAGSQGWAGGIDATAAAGEDAGGGWRRYRLKYGELDPYFEPFDAQYLGLAADHDGGSATAGWASASFRNVRVHDDGDPAAPPPPTGGGTFSIETVVSGLTEPTATAFLPGADVQTMLVAQKDGVVRVVRGGQLLAAPFIDLRSVVNNVRDRGLLGLAVHPDFPSKPYVYVAYTYDPPETAGRTGLAGPDGKGNRAARVERIEADLSGNALVAKPGGRVVILGANSTWANISRPDGNSTADGSIPESGLRPDGGRVPDFIATDSESHGIGALAFGLDKSLFVTVGDGASYGIVDRRAVRVQDLDSLSGKLLRVDPLTGRGLVDNPFYDGDAGHDRSKVYALGLRNPFRLAIDPTSGEPFVGDVGWTAWEEVNTGRGANFGWPFFEGGYTTAGGSVNLPTKGYQDLAEGRAFYATNPTITAPLYAESHPDGARAVILGTFNRRPVGVASPYPSSYANALFLSDFGRNAVKAIRLTDAGAVGSVETLTGRYGQIVQMSQGPDGRIYIVDLYGKVGRLMYA